MARLGERVSDPEMIWIREEVRERERREEREALERYAQELLDLGDASAVADSLEEYLSDYLRGIECSGGFGG